VRGSSLTAPAAVALPLHLESTMPRQVLFIQGGGDGAHDEWDNRLVDRLGRELGPDYEIRYPRMPNEADPKYARWKAAIKKEFGKLDDGAILVGHSVGGTILINTLAEEPPDLPLRGIFLLAAPFVGESGWPSEDIKPIPDLGKRLPAQALGFLYHGSEDETAPFEHVGLYAKAIPQAFVRRLNGRDHQFNNDMSDVAADIRRLGDGGE
jgi:predicted alpha/beta hydrolase family esterase